MYFGWRALAMQDDAKHDISRQLAALYQGGGTDADAWHDLVPLVYDELRAIARRQLLRERDSHTLNTTALVHEAYLRLVNQRHAHWLDRAQFFAIAARVMRRILIDYARRHRAEKRGGRDLRVPIDGLDTREEIQLAEVGERAELLMSLDDALTSLATIDERLARVVECRFFGGLTEEETAAALGVTARTVRRDWVKAKEWLRGALDE
jgi:RNA polymerase sigma factor (TIGR02999 family)